MSWNLQLQSADANNRFKDYLRTQAKSKAVIFIPIQFLLILFSVTASHELGGESLASESFDHLALLLGPGAIISAFILAASCMKSLFIEMLLPAQLFVQLLMIITSSRELIPGVELTHQALLMNSLIFFSSYVVFLLFLSASWGSGFLIRFFIMLIGVVYTFYARMQFGGFVNTTSNLTPVILVTIALEFAVYSQVKSQAILFVKIKHVE